MQNPDINEPLAGTRRRYDFYVKIEGTFIRCNRTALVTASNYFNTMFNSPYQGGETRPITLDHNVISADTFVALRTMIYDMYGVPDGRQVRLVMEDVCPLLRAADYLELKPELEKVITDFIEENVPNKHMFEVASFAERTGRHLLFYQMTKCISCHLKKYSETSEFLESPLEVIKMVIDTSTLKEEIVVKSIMQWINHRREERWKCFSQLTRLGMMAGVVTTQIESMARSLIPDGTSDEVVASYLEELKRTSIDETLRVYWIFSNLDSREIFEVSIHDTVNCNILKTDVHCGAMKKVVWDRSIVYSLNYMGLYNMEDGYGFVEFRSYTLDGKILKTLKPPIETSEEKRIYYNNFLAHFHLSSLPNIKQIYLYNSQEQSLHVYHCDKDEWNELKLEKKGSWATTATCGTSNIVYLVGGETGDAYLQAYDCCAEKWRDNLPNPKRRYPGGAAMCVLNGELYLYNESDRVFEIYDPSKNEWHTSKPNPHIEAGCPKRILAYGDELWLFASASVNFKNACTAYLYRPKSNSWRKYPVMITAMEQKAGSFDLKTVVPRFLDAVVY